jgi:type IV secretory pathway TraG/TraD family ATPase VirD4
VTKPTTQPSQPSTMLGLPPAISQYLTLPVIGTAIGLLIIWWWIREKPRNSKDKLGTARWVDKSDVANAWKIANKQFNAPEKKQLVTWINTPRVGRKLWKKGHKLHHTKNTVMVPDCQRGTAICGAPGSGKTFSSFDPMIQSVIEQGLPLILYDAKYPEGQAEMHIAYAMQQGYEVKVFAPGYAESEICNILDFMEDSEDGVTAAQIGKTMARNFSMNGGSDGDPFFALSGDQLIKAVMQTAKMLHPEQIADVATCQTILQIPPVELINRVKNAPMSPWVKISWSQFFSMAESEKTAASVAATAALLFTNMIDKAVLPSLCGKSTIPLKLKGKQMLVLGMDSKRRDIVGPILATVLEALVQANFAEGGRTDPLAIFLDEIPSLLLPNLESWLNELRSKGAAFFIGFQNISMLEKAYKESGLKAILTGCNTKIIFNPGELESAEYFSKYLGEIELNFQQRTRSQGQAPNSSSNSYADQRQARALITTDQINRLPTGSCLMISPSYGNKDEAYVPQKLSIAILDDVIQKAKFGSDNFQKIITEMRKKGDNDKSIDLELRKAAVDRLIPDVSSVKSPDADAVMVANAINNAMQSAVGNKPNANKQADIEKAMQLAHETPF